MKIVINTDSPNGSYTYNLVNEIKKRGLYTEDLDADVVFNIDSIHKKGIRKGKKLTIYWEIEDYRFLGGNKLFYSEVGLLYIGHKKYLPYYPAGTKVMYLACNPDFHKDTGEKKIFDLVFVGGIEYLPTYFDRITTLHYLQVKGINMGVLYGKPSEYPKLNSMGRMILNILPKTLEGNAHINCRVYEAMAMGCLVNNYNSILNEVIIPNIHYVTLDKFENITQEEIDKIKKVSRELVIAKHTWSHRVDQLLEDINDRI